ARRRYPTSHPPPPGVRPGLRVPSNSLVLALVTLSANDVSTRRVLKLDAFPRVARSSRRIDRMASAPVWVNREATTSQDTRNSVATTEVGTRTTATEAAGASLEGRR